MSFRKPKSVVIRGGYNDDDDTVETGTSRSLEEKKTQPRQRNKIKLKTLNQEFVDDDGIDSLDIQIKKKKKRSTLSIPLFGDDNIESTGNSQDLPEQSIRHQFLVQKKKIAKNDGIKQHPNDNKVLSALPQQEYVNQQAPIEAIPDDDGALEYISIESPTNPKIKDEEEEDAEDDGGFNANFDILDDGRLPLTEGQAVMQRKLQEMDIEDALYEAEISGDEEMEDWETEKLKHGAFGNADIERRTRTKLPKLNLLEDEPLSQSIEAINSALVEISHQKKHLSESIEQANADLGGFKAKLEQIASKINDL